MLDCYGCPKEKLADMGLVRRALEAVPEMIKMTKVMPPYVFKYVGQVPEEWGVSGVALIAEAHSSIHTFPDKEHAFIDIFSSKDFDADYACRELLKIFEATDHEALLLNRGVEALKNIGLDERPRVYN